MPLLFNVRQLEKQNLFLRGELSAAELELEEVDECVRVAQPLKHDLQVELLGGDFLVRGRLETTLECTCVRCLKTFQRLLELPEWICHLEREGEDKAVIVNDCVDLTPYVREDILLAFPQHPLCEPGCHGLPYSSTSSKHQNSGSLEREVMSSTWAALNKLKL
jgi:uncharacterized protein